MTGRFFGADGASNDVHLDPFSERRVAERLRSALADHADRVEPAPNSYLALAARLEEVGSPKQPGSRGGRLLAAAAMFLVVAGAGAFVVSQGRTGDVDAVGSDGADGGTAITAPAVTTTLATTVPTAAEVPSTTTIAPSPPAALMVNVLDRASLPGARDAAAAANEFTHLLGLPGKARYVANGDSVQLLPPDQGDSSIARISVAESDDGMVATGATSENVQISEVFVDGDELVVRGQAISFEAAVDVHVVGTDGTRISSTFTMAGCCEELTPFEARLGVFGVGQGFVVAHGDNAGSGVVSAFAAVPIEFESLVGAGTYTVFRIRPDDIEKGLNIRDLPGTDEGRVLATLPPGETGITRLPVMPALVGDSFWWKVRTGGGIEGWVHSSFLTPDSSSLVDPELVAAADGIVANINAAEFDGLDYIGLSRRVPVALGWIGDPRLVSGPELLELDMWTEAGKWAVPEATFGESEKVISLRSLLNLPETGDFEPIISAGPRPIYGFEQEWVERYFAGTKAVTVVGADADGTEFGRSIMLFFEAGPTGPTLVGVVASVFVP